MNGLTRTFVTRAALRQEVCARVGKIHDSAAERRQETRRAERQAERRAAGVCIHCGADCGEMCQKQMDTAARLLTLWESRLLAKEAALKALPTVCAGLEGGEAFGKDGGSGGAGSTGVERGGRREESGYLPCVPSAD